MKQTVTLILIRIFILFFITVFGQRSLYGTEGTRVVSPETEEATCLCACDKEKDLAALKALYQENGGVNWDFSPSAYYVDLLRRDSNNGYFNVPNAGTVWNINDPNAENLMGDWHGVETNQFGCVTSLILWSGEYGDGEGMGLTGALTDSLTQLCALQRLMVPHNELTSLPTGLDDLCSLEVLLLHDNQFTGSLPLDIANIPTLLQLDLQQNEFTGTLPAAYTTLSELMILHLQGNKLTGTLPATIGDWERMIVLNLSDNCFAGTIPVSIVDIGKDSRNGGVFTGGIGALYLQNNKLDSLPNISALSVLNNHRVDVSGNQLTFDDLIPNINILTEYDSQAIALNQYYCLEEGEIFELRPGFDELVDSNFYGDTSRYVWKRGTDFMASSGLNILNFPAAGSYSEGNFSISVTNVLAPNVTLEITNILVEVNYAAPLIGALEVCAGETETYTVDDAKGYDWTVSGGTIVAMDTMSISINWARDTMRELCAIGRSDCSKTTCFEITDKSALLPIITPPDNLNCATSEVILVVENASTLIEYFWLNDQDELIGYGPSVEVMAAGIYVLVSNSPENCETRDTVTVVEEPMIAAPTIAGDSLFCEGGSTILGLDSTYASYAWSTGEMTTTLEIDTTGTYSVTVTDDKGCTAVATTEVIKKSLPIVSLSKSNDIDCQNPTVSLFGTPVVSGSRYEWKDTTGTILGTDPFLSITNAGNYTLVVTNQSGCMDSSQIEVLVDTAIPTANAGIDQSLNCTTRSILLDGSNSIDANSYTWSNEAGEVLSNNSTLAVNEGGLYTLNIVNAQGCIANDQVLITDSSYRITPNIVGAAFLCSGSMAPLSVNENYTTYQWSTGDTIPTIQIDSAGIYTITVTDSSGCTGMNSVNIVERPGLTVEISGDTAFCEGGTASLSVSPFGAEYEWSTGSISGFILADSAGTYTVTVTDANGCTGIDAITITSSPTLAVEISGDTSFCEGGTASLSVSPFIADYEWSTGSTSGFILVDSAGTYTVTVTDANGCTGIDAITITSSPTLAVEISGDTTFCEGGTTSLSVSPFGAEYEWSTGSTSGFILADSAGTYTVTVTDANGCTGIDAITVTSSPTLAVEISGDTSFCEGGTASLSVSPFGADYEWSTGSTSGFILADSAGTYTVTVTDANGCTGIDAITITSSPTLAVEISGDTTFCEGGTASLSVSPFGADYEWSTGSTSGFILVDSAGTYTVTVTDINGCVGTDSITINSAPSLSVEIKGTSTFCEGTSTTLEVEGSYSIYEWSTGATTATIDIDTAGIYAVTVTNVSGCTGEATFSTTTETIPSFSILGEKNICAGGSTILMVDTSFDTYTWSNGETSQAVEIDLPGMYTVSVQHAGGCRGSLEVTITESDNFEATIVGDTVICKNGASSLVANPFNGTNYQWSTGETSSFIIADSAGLYTVTVTDDKGCTSEATQSILERPLPTIDFSDNAVICEGSSATIGVLQAYPSYEWSTGSRSQIITITEADVYTVTVVDENGCKNELTRIILEQSGPVLPTGEVDLLCQGGTTTLQAPENYAAYKWSTGEISTSIEVDQPDDYQVTVTDNDGCSGTMVISVTETTSIAPQIIGNPLLCKGVTTKLTTDKDFTSYLWSTGSTQETITIGMPGEYAVQVMDETGCVGESSFLVKEAPDIEFEIVGNLAICGNASTILRTEESYSAYEWNTGATTQSVEVNQIGDYSLLVTDAGGCTGTATVTVEENTILLPQITGIATLCENGTTAISADADYFSYAWSTGDTTKSITVDTIGTYDLIVTNEEGCRGITSITLNQDTIFQPKIIGNPFFCTGATTLLSTDSSYTAYLWSGGANTETLEILTPGVYGLTVTNENGCTGSTEIEVVENLQLAPAILGDTIICTGDSIYLTASEGFLSYRWNTGDTTAQIEVATAQTYRVTVTSENGCSGTSNTIVKEVSPPMLGNNDKRYLCEGDTTLSTIGLPGFSEYIWSTGDTIGEIPVTQEGEYLVTVTNEVGCTGTTKIEVEEKSAPNARINLSGDINCTGGTALLLTVANDVTYQWTLDSIALPDRVSSLQIDKGGLYTLTLTDRTTGCTASASKNVAENNRIARLVIDDTKRVLTCTNKELLIEVDTLKSINVNQFSWTRKIITETGVIITEELTNTTGQLNVGAAGNYTLIGVDSMEQCKDTIVIEVLDSIMPVAIKPTINVPPNICEGEMIEIGTQVPYYRYNWLPGEDTTATISGPLSGTYQVTVTNEEGCTETTSTTINTKEFVDLMIDITTNKPDGICEDSEAQINFNILDNGIGPYDITYTDGIMEHTLSNVKENIATIDVVPTATNRYEITEIIDKGNSCYTTNSIDTAFLSFIILERPTATSVKEKICAIEGSKEATFDLKSLDGKISSDNRVVNWYTGEGDGQVPIINPNQFRSRTTTVYARVTDGKCESDTVPIQLEVDDCSQNIEMTHEAGVALDLSYLEGEEREVYITNRWGDLVYASKDYENTSDKFKGTNLPQGAYYIYIKNKEEGLPIPYKGVIYLLK